MQSKVLGLYAWGPRFDPWLGNPRCYKLRGTAKKNKNKDQDRSVGFSIILHPYTCFSLTTKVSYNFIFFGLVTCKLLSLLFTKAILLLAQTCGRTAQMAETCWSEPEDWEVEMATTQYIFCWDLRFKQYEWTQELIVSSSLTEISKYIYKYFLLFIHLVSNGALVGGYTGSSDLHCSNGIFLRYVTAETLVVACRI